MSSSRWSRRCDPWGMGEIPVSDGFDADRKARL